VKRSLFALTGVSLLAVAGADDKKPAAKLPPKWSSHADFAAVEDKDPHGGKAALRLSAWAKPPGYAWAASEKVKVKAGQEYTLSAWVKSDGTDGESDFVCVRWYKDGKYLDQHGPPVGKGETKWTEVTATATPPDGATHLDFAVFVRSKAGTVWIDDASVTETGGDTNLIPNPGFEPDAK
jgi:hypothetical protein